ncbi:MAG: class I SAM-dependent methyltransferase [Haloarculaceae archaeon]
METAAPFEAHTERYDQWFEDHEDAYRSELAALRRLVPETGRGLAVGVGTGRFAAPLGVEVGLDPAESPLARARERGIEVTRGVAEHLPFRDGAFDTVLVVTTVCFVDDIPRMLAEADRVLAASGRLVVGYVDRESPLGRVYQEHKDENPFYREATFVTTDELREELAAAGFTDTAFVQTIFGPLEEVDGPEPVEEGYGDGSFVAVRAGR